MREVRAPGNAPVRRRAGWLALVGMLLLAAGCQADADALPHVERGSNALRPASAEVPAPRAALAANTRTACDLAAWLVGETLGVETERSGRSSGGSLAHPGSEGCRLTAVGSFDDLPDDVETPVDLLFDAYDEGGWFEDTRYASDTDESSALGMWKEGVLCVIGAVWTAADDYADHEPTEEELRYDLAVECVPAEVPPIPLWGSTT